MELGIDRRRFLALASAILATSATTFAQDASKPTAGANVVAEGAEKPESPLAACARRSRETGKPVLVMLAKLPDRYDERGLQWAAVLDLAPDDALADIALCELAFA